MLQRESENVITDLMIRWGKNYLGQNLSEVKTDIIRDMVIVSFKGEISPAESHLSKEREGMLLVKKIHQQLIEYDREFLGDSLLNLTGSRMVSLHTDVSTKTGQRIFVFRMDRVLD